MKKVFKYSERHKQLNIEEKGYNDLLNACFIKKSYFWLFLHFAEKMKDAEEIIKLAQEFEDENLDKIQEYQDELVWIHKERKRLLKEWYTPF